MTVLRALPQLEKLDDIAVKPEDIQGTLNIKVSLVEVYDYRFRLS